MAALDRFLPDAPYAAVHATRIHAAPEAVWAAMRAVTADELALSRILVAMRTLSLRRLRPGAGGERTAMDGFLRSGFTLLDEDEPHALVLATTGSPWHLRGAQLTAPRDAAAFAAHEKPGTARMAMSLELAADGGATRLATETRIAPTDDDAARAFGRYWAVVRHGSGLVRHDLLRAVRRRAERA